MRVDQIHYYRDSHRMRGIYQFLKFLRSTEPRRRRKKTGNMISKTTVIGMLLYCHNLNTVVTIIPDTRKDILPKLHICTHLLLLLGHSNVALINEKGVFLGFESLDFEPIWCFRIPYLCRKNVRVIILDHPLAPRRNTVPFTAVPFDTHLVMLTMPDAAVRNADLPVTVVIQTVKAEFFLFSPIIEITYEIDIAGVWSPLTEYPFVSFAVQTVIIVTLSKLGKCTFAACQGFLTLHCMIMTSLNSILKRL